MSSRTDLPDEESPSDTAPAPGATAARRGIVGLLARLHDWAESGWAGSAVGTWGLLQGSFVPGPADALLLPLGISDPPRAPRLAVWAFAGSFAGGIIAYLVGRDAFEAIGRPVLSLIGVSAANLEASRALFERRGAALVLLSAVSPLSTKAVCLAAGAFGVPLVPFLGALAAGRGARFTVVGAALRFAGGRLERWIRSRSA